MLYDKIKIYVTPKIMAVIEKDAESFEFFKKDGITPNKNAFLTRLVVNYSEEFIKKQGEEFDYLRVTIGKRVGISESILSELCREISEHVSDSVASPEGEKFDRLLSLKPTRESTPVIEYIEGCALRGGSLSEYFRNMLASYASMPQDRREGVIFKEQKEALLRAIKEKKKVFITTSFDKNGSMEVSPYSLASTKEELHGYLLAGVGKGCMPVRLSRIRSVTVLTLSAEFTDAQMRILSRMEEYGPQFIYGEDDEEIVVELSEIGRQWFKKLYVHRPTPYKVEGNIYTFRCSHGQVINYFRRFGRHAYVLSPQSVRDGITAFHRSAHNYYRERERQVRGKR